MNDQNNVIATLDLEPIKVKLMHRESGEGWTQERANAIETEYRRFLMLMKKYPNEQTAPLTDVDTFWHYHILDTMKYAEDCAAVFGYFLHHFPYIGMRGEDDEAAHLGAGQRMKELYEAEFGEPYARSVADGQAAYCGVVAQTAYCGVVAKTAYCGVVAKAAYCGVVANTAYCGVVEKTAYCGVAAKTAYCGVVAAQAKPQADAAIEKAGLSSFYGTRPRQTAA